MPYELVWAATRGHDANTMIGPVLGLPELPVVGLPMRINADHGPFFKTLVLAGYTRPPLRPTDQAPGPVGAGKTSHNRPTTM